MIRQKGKKRMTYEEAAAVIPEGLYRHFKGNYYRVLYIARHSETTEPMVVYRALYKDRGIWVRPADMWNETVERDGKTQQRFHLLNSRERVEYYEQIFDELSLTVQKEEPLTDERKDKLLLLEEYYSSGEWQADYEADEAGLFPADLKRGVLSQDGLYDLLERLQP